MVELIDDGLVDVVDVLILLLLSVKSLLFKFKLFIWFWIRFNLIEFILEDEFEFNNEDDEDELRWLWEFGFVLLLVMALEVDEVENDVTDGDIDDMADELELNEIDDWVGIFGALLLLLVVVAVFVVLPFERCFNNKLFVLQQLLLLDVFNASWHEVCVLIRFALVFVIVIELNGWRFI